MNTKKTGRVNIGTLAGAGLALIAAMLSAGCETGGAIQVYGSGNSGTGSGAYWGSNGSGWNFGGTGTVQVNGGQISPGGYVWVQLPWGSGGSQNSRGDITWIDSNNVDIDASGGASW